MAPTQLMERADAPEISPSDESSLKAESTTTFPTYAEFVSRVMQECEVTSEVARAFYTILDSAARNRGYAYHLTALELKTTHDSVLELVMPDDEQAPGKGTIHDDANAHFSGMLGWPVELVHSKTVNGLVEDCNVIMINVGSLVA